MSLLKTSKLLPPELRINTIDDILYSIGLCDHSVAETPKRSRLHNPLLITMILLFNILMRIVSNTSDNKTLLILTGDFGHYIGIKEYQDIFMILAIFFGIILSNNLLLQHQYWSEANIRSGISGIVGFYHSF